MQAVQRHAAAQLPQLEENRGAGTGTRKNVVAFAKRGFRAARGGKRTLSEPRFASWIYEYAPLIDFDADRLDDGAPFGDFRFKELFKLLGRRALGQVAGFGQLVFDRRVGESCVGIGADLADDLRRRLGG